MAKVNIIKNFTAIPSMAKGKNRLSRQVPIGRSQDTLFFRIKKAEENPVSSTLERILAAETNSKDYPITSKIYGFILKQELKLFYKSEERHIINFLKKHKKDIIELDKQYQTVLKPMFERIKLLRRSKPVMLYELENLQETFLKTKKDIDRKYAKKILNGLAKEFGIGDIGPNISFKNLNNTVGGWNSATFSINIDPLAYKSPKNFISLLVHEFTHFKQDFDILRKYGAPAYTKLRTIRLYLRSQKEIPDKKLAMSQIAKQMFLMDLQNPYLEKITQLAAKKKLGNHTIRGKLAKIILAESAYYKSARNSTEEEYFAQLIEKQAYFNAGKVKKHFESIIPVNHSIL